MKKYIVKENGETVGVFMNAGQACALNDEYMKYGRSCTIDIVTDPDETETENNEEEETMYNYEETMKNDILDYIAENIDRTEFINDRDGLEEQLNDDMWTADSVTGNASGSYFCNAYRAREAFQNDRNAEDYFAEACDCFDCDPAEVGRHFIRGDYEWIDCTIRCYLLGGMIQQVLDELEEAGYFEESETDEADILQEVREAIA